MSHFLHGCWSNHDRHGNLESQDSGGHVYLADIDKNTWPEPVFYFFPRKQISGHHYFVYSNQKQRFFDNNQKQRLTAHQSAKISQDSGKGISVLCKSPLVLSTRSIIIKHHLWQLLLCNCLILSHISYLHFKSLLLILSLTNPTVY